MTDWRITEEGFRPDRITSNGNKFFTGNGYLGIRGTLPEYEKDEFPAINLSGIYDQVGDAWREPLNAPNGLFTCLTYDGVEYRLPEEPPSYHRISLDYRHGILNRETVWDTPSGNVSIYMERFASMNDKHLIVMEYRIHTEGGGPVTIFTGIDGEVWDINGPHYDEMEFIEEDGILMVEAITHENRDSVFVCEACQADFPLPGRDNQVLCERIGSEREDNALPCADSQHLQADQMMPSADIQLLQTDKVLPGADNNLPRKDIEPHNEATKPLRKDKAPHTEDNKLLRKDNRLLREYVFQAEAGQTYTLVKWVSIYTSRDTEEYHDKGVKLVKEAAVSGYKNALNRQIAEWEKLWSNSEVFIEGDPAAMEAMNYSIYHLQSIAPRHTDSLSIPARGLSGQTYKGAVFWDTEMFMLDLLLFTDPSVAKTLLKYRIDTLPGAIRKAQSYGYQGAFYAWESQEGGYDACSDYNVIDVFTGRPMRTYFKDKQIHISAAVVYGIMKYTDYTGNLDLLDEGGAEVIIECARFYHGLLLQKLGLSRYELHDVIGPDEYHERVNNNAYTNRMVKYTFEIAIRVIELIKENKICRKYHHEDMNYHEDRIHLDDTYHHEVMNNHEDRNHLDDTYYQEDKYKLDGKYDLNMLLKCFKDAADRLYIPEPDTDSLVIEQFDGYLKLEDVTLEKLRSRLLNEKEYWGGANGIAAHTQIIKQADVVTMLNLFSGDYNKEILYKNWEYYEPRTEHGSSLSACMYAILACRCDMPDKAYPLFLKSATADLKGEGKEWAGLIYIGGTHPAAAGGAYKTVLKGFAGLREEDGRLIAEPKLPSHWNRLRFKVMYRGDRYQVDITKDGAELVKLLD